MSGLGMSGWGKLPLYTRISIGLVLGVAVGLVFGPSVAALDVPAKLVLRVLGALAPPIVLVAIVRALLTAGGLLGLNTLVAIGVGLLVANVLQPGRRSDPQRPEGPPKLPSGNILEQLQDNIPESLLRPLVENKVIGVVLLALAVGLAGRGLAEVRKGQLLAAVEIAFDLVIRVLHWIIALVPFAVFGKVAAIVGKSGFADFEKLLYFVIAVLVALAVQAAYYLIRIRFGSWLRPTTMLRGMKDAFVMAFSTASSTATMPVTYERLRQLGLRDKSASLGALVGSNFNNDGTALYEAMSALFIAQLLGHDLSLVDQLLVVITSVVASVGAAGIPEAGLVTMTLVFTAVRLPTEYIALLLTVDWFLDRCRTTINVMGDVNVACLLDGRVPATEDARSAVAAEPKPT
jgi:Na+/H+-dicarboxylate symporter